MKSGFHKKSFSSRDLLSCNCLLSSKTDPFSTPRLNTKKPLILRPICHKRQNSESIKSSPFIQVPLEVPETCKNMISSRMLCNNIQYSDTIKSSPFTRVTFEHPESCQNRIESRLFNNSQMNKNPCFFIPKPYQKLNELKTPSLIKVSKAEPPLKTARAHQASLSHLNKQMVGKMNRLIKRREEKVIDSSLDFSFGAKNNSALNN